MHGFVLVDVQKQISGSALMVCLSGEERTNVTYVEGDWSCKKIVGKKFKPVVKGVRSMMSCFDDNRYDRHRSKDAAVRILAVEVPVGTQSMIESIKVEPGKYKLPFEIDLPPSLPASMHLSEEEGYCEIHYEIEAHLEGSGWFSNYKASRIVFIQPKPVGDTGAVVPFEGPPDTMAIKLFRCMHLGDMTYGCLMENTVLACGQTAEIMMTCQNDSALGVNCVKAELIQITAWEASGYESEHEKTIASQSFANWDDLIPITKEEFQERLSARSARDFSSQKSKILEELRAGTHKVSLFVPINARPTYEGQIISVRHVLRLRLVSSYFLDFVAPCPKVEIPLQILATELDSVMPPFDLPAWAHDVANLVVTSAVYIPSQAIAYSGVVLDSEADAGASPISEVQGEPSVKVLLEAMIKTSNHQGLINQKIKDDKWNSVFAGLSPVDYGSILSQVQLHFRKPKIAVAIAKSCSDFTCAHVTSGTKECPEWMRASTIGQLLPYVRDLNENK